MTYEVMVLAGRMVVNGGSVGGRGDNSSIAHVVCVSVGIVLQCIGLLVV